MSKQEIPSEIVAALDKSKKVIAITGHSIENRDGPAATQKPSADLAALFKQLLTSLRYTTTCLSLAFKPPITPSAIDQQLRKFTDEICRTVSFVIAAANGAGLSSTLLLTEWADGVTDIITEAQRYLELVATGDYLQLTGMVWSAIDKMADLSSTESEALTKRWKEDTATVKDAWCELQDMLSAEPDMEDALEDEVFSPEEKAEAERVKPILAFYKILQATLPRDFASLDDAVSLKPLLRSSHDFCAAFDDAVCSLHPPQAGTELQDLQQAATEMIKQARASGISTSFLHRWEEKRREVEG